MVRNPSGERALVCQRGASRVGCLLSLALFTLAGYAAVLLVGSEFKYRSVEQAIDQELRTTKPLATSPREIRAAVVARIEDLGLPPSARNVELSRLPEGGVVVSFAYPDTITFFGRWHWVRTRRITERPPD